MLYQHVKKPSQRANSAVRIDVLFEVGSQHSLALDFALCINGDKRIIILMLCYIPHLLITIMIVLRTLLSVVMPEKCCGTSKKLRSNYVLLGNASAVAPVKEKQGLLFQNYPHQFKIYVHIRYNGLTKLFLLVC